MSKKVFTEVPSCLKLDRDGFFARVHITMLSRQWLLFSSAYKVIDLIPGAELSSPLRAPGEEVSKPQNDPPDDQRRPAAISSSRARWKTRGTCFLGPSLVPIYSPKSQCYVLEWFFKFFRAREWILRFLLIFSPPSSAKDQLATASPVIWSVC